MARKTTRQETEQFLIGQKAFVYEISQNGTEFRHAIIAGTLCQANERIEKLYPGDWELETQSARVSL